MHPWFQALSDRVEALRTERPVDRIAVSIDADGTLLDPRPAIVDVLQAADRRSGLARFADVTPAALAGRPPAEALERLLPAAALADARRLLGARLDAELAPAARARLLDAVRWLQMHPMTFVALASDRDTSRSAATLAELRRTAGGRGLRFTEDLLLLGGGVQEQEGAPRRTELTRLVGRGFTVAALVERDPQRLAALAAEAGRGGPLCLDGRALADDAQQPRSALSGPSQLNATDIGSRAALTAFIASTAGWAELEVASDARGDLFVAGAPDGEQAVPFEEALGMLAQGGKGLVLCLGSNDTVVARTLLALGRSGFRDDSIQFSAAPHRWSEPLFRALVAERGGAAVARASIDPFTDEALGDPRTLVRRLQALHALGVRRFGVSWHGPARNRLLEALDVLRLEADIARPRGLDAFLAACSRAPAAVTCELPAAREPERLDEPAAPFAVRTRPAQPA